MLGGEIGLQFGRLLPSRVPPIRCMGIAPMEDGAWEDFNRREGSCAPPPGPLLGARGSCPQSAEGGRRGRPRRPRSQRARLPSTGGGGAQDPSLRFRSSPPQSPSQRFRCMRPRRWLGRSLALPPSRQIVACAVNRTVEGRSSQASHRGKEQPSLASREGAAKPRICGSTASRMHIG